MSDSNNHEKSEKEDEKKEEKSPEEKSWDEKWRRDPLSTAIWALIFIWAGVVLLLSNLGVLNALLRTKSSIPGLGWIASLEAWGLILLGAGILVLIEAIIRLTVPTYRQPVTGSIFVAIILIGIGLGNMFRWDLVWPLILIALGLTIILRGIARRR
ncbi:MAG: hypothetical protein PHD58_05735 [Anaerolineales bacterium]|nr:hypothetical protein [Anaerolineales bacterium]